MSAEALRLALAALENSRPLANEDDFSAKVSAHNEAIKACRAELAAAEAQPVQEPAAWLMTLPGCDGSADWAEAGSQRPKPCGPAVASPLYAKPQPAPDLLAALREADALMDHCDEPTAWREKWAHLFQASASKSVQKRLAVQTGVAMSAPFNPAAFPVTSEHYADKYCEQGMSLRDYFAAKAMQALLHPGISGEWLVATYGTPDTSVSAYDQADAMLKARLA